MDFVMRKGKWILSKHHLGHLAGYKDLALNAKRVRSQLNYHTCVLQIIRHSNNITNKMMLKIRKATNYR